MDDLNHPSQDIDQGIGVAQRRQLSVNPDRLIWAYFIVWVAALGAVAVFWSDITVMWRWIIFIVLALTSPALRDLIRRR